MTTLVKKVLIVYDVDNWAFHAEALTFSKWLSEEGIEVDITRARNVGNVGNVKEYDLIFNMMYYWNVPFKHHNMITQISSYSYWIRKNNNYKLPEFYKYIVCKNSDIFQKLDNDVKNKILLYHPVDTSLFKPVDKKIDEITFGFVGHDRPTKGLDIIKKAINETGSKLKTIIFSKDTRFDRNEMANFYHSIDCYICASKLGADAGPMTAVEAFFCGLPVITTHVGQIQEMIEDKENGLIINRDVKSMSEAINFIKRNISSMNEKSKLNYEKWGEKNKNEWILFFKKML